MGKAIKRESFEPSILDRCDEMGYTYLGWCNDRPFSFDARFGFKCNKHGRVGKAGVKNFFSRISCRSCADEFRGKLQRKGGKTLIEKAKGVHGDLFDYSLVPEDIGVKDKVDIICREHGVFSQNMDNHTNNRRGCPHCSTTGYSSYKSGYLYLLKVDAAMLKFGITNNHPDERIYQIQYHTDFYIEPLRYYKFEDGLIPKRIEQEILRDSSIRRSFLDKSQMKSGYTETTYIFYLRNILDIIDKYVEDNDAEYQLTVLRDISKPV